MYNTISFVDNTLFIEGNFYNNVWFKDFGKVQHEMLECKNTQIHVNLKKCIFISPTPFLSLLMTLFRVKVENGCNVSFSFGDSFSDEKRKFHNFCAREGFLNIINEISENNYDLSKFKEYNMIGNENFENILSARIVNLKKQGYNIEEIVSALINEINESNLNINKKQKLYMIVALRNILQELIDNVYKHAYDKENKYFALYIRIRYATDVNMRKGKENNTYSRRGPTTKPDEIYVHKAIEIYFQDIGKGIVKSYEEKGITYANRPLREIVQSAFFGEKFQYRHNNTSINGLAFLRKILQEKNNYFTVYNQFEGTGAFGVPDRKKIVNCIKVNDLKEDIEYGIVGQIYNFTLFDRDYKKNVKRESYKGLLETYQQEYTRLDNYIIDFRKIEEVEENQKELVILFMPLYVTKYSIISKLRMVLQRISKLKTLIISDVKDDELVLFDHALNDTYIELFKKDYREQFDIEKIVVVTESLDISFFQVEKRKIIKRELSFKNFDKEYKYLYRIKIYESEQLAEILATNTIGKYILTKGTIEWTKEQKFKGFINFDMLTSNDICFNLMKRNLERIMPLIGGKKLYAIDSAVERLVSSVNCFRENHDKERFGVGSIFVSGMTLQSSDYQGNTIHFFNRGKGERKPALFFDPVYLYAREEQGSENTTYVRIGKSSRIKRKYYIEPKRNTNSFLDEKEIYKMLHQYAYSSVLCGHSNFEKRHDLLSINLNAIMYDENTRLAEYVEGMIKYSLGHYFQKKLEESEYFRSLRNACLIVYPYNQFTSAILKKCKIDEEYFEYIVGLTSTNITSFGEALEYAECFTAYITEIIKLFKQKYPGESIKIVVFDTLSYSGRTRQEIYEYIDSIEHVEPYYVSIIDAKVNHYPKKKNTLNYINLSIPLLGRTDNCKICLGLSKLDIFKDNVIDASILVIIESIQATWAVRDIRNCSEIIKLRNFERIYAKSISKYNVEEGNYKEDLYFVNALPLYIYITNRIKKENDFSAMEFVLDTYDKIIGSDSMSYMLSLFILEYGDIIYHSLLQKICNYILIYIKESNETELKQLSVISLLSLDEQRSEKIVLKFIEENIHNLQSSVEGQLVFMYFLNKEKNQNNNIRVAFLYNKMKSGNDRLDLYKQFHCQLKNTNGNVHNSPLMSLAERQESIANRRLTMASLSLLEHSLNCTELSFDILYEEGRIQSDDSIDEEISTVRENCLKEISETKSLINQNGDLKNIREKLKNIFAAGQLLHRRLFAPYKIQNNAENRGLTSIETLLAERIDNYNKKRKKGKLAISFNESYSLPTDISNNIASLYFIWNNMLVREIEYILDNVGKFTNESNCVMIDKEKNAGEVKIKIGSDNFEISIFNNTDETVENIRQKAKQRYQKEVLSLLGIKFLYTENNGENPLFSDKAVVTKIIIPNIQNRKEQ